MRKAILVGLMAVCAAIGIWASWMFAPQVGGRIAQAAAPIMATTRHAMQVHVTGRNAEVSGMADDTREKARVIAALQAISGIQSVSSDQVTILAAAAPFIFEVQKDGGLKVGGLTAKGNVPSEVARAQLAAVLGAAQVAGLTLASGAPEGWLPAALVGIAALAPLSTGAMRIEGGTVILTGNAQGKQELEAVKKVIATSAALVVNGIGVLDDGTPVKYGLSFTKAGGFTLRGKLPKGLTVAGMAKVLGVKRIKGDVAVAQAGPEGEADYLAAWAGILGQIETLTSAVNGENRKVLAKLSAGADMAAVTAALATGGFVTEITPPPAAEGDKRSNADTGVDEVFQAGQWIAVAAPPAVKPVANPVAAPVPAKPAVLDVQQCQQATDAVFAATKLAFLPNSNALDASGAGVIAHLAQAMRPCTAAGLRAEIGGHTDISGDAAQNLALSQRRADAVRSALIAQGLAAGALTATGYGTKQPIFDNATADGRAKNRRTAVIWGD